MRAQRRSKQKIDPVIYCNYYILLEKVFKLYTDYERQYAKCLLTLKDDKIDKIDKLSIENQEQSKKIDQQSIEIKHLNDKIDILFDYFF